jgi:cytochrome c553
MRVYLFKIFTGLAVVAATSLPSYADSDSILTPESVHIQRCSACHYVDGKSAGPEFPNIAGQYENYLMKALKLFKENKRDSEAMELITSLHREQELVILANYYAKQKPAEAPALTSPDQTQWSRGQQIFTAERIYGISCADCHGEDAKGYVPKSPRTRNVRAIPSLAGQQPGYLKAVLHKYTEAEGAGARLGMCAMMRKAGKTLSQSDVDALAEYLSSK